MRKGKNEDIIISKALIKAAKETPGEGTNME